MAQLIKVIDCSKLHGLSSIPRSLCGGEGRKVCQLLSTDLHMCTRKYLHIQTYMPRRIKCKKQTKNNV